MIIYNHDTNHNLMVVMICFVVIPDSLDGSTHTGIGSDQNSMSCVHDDHGKLFVIFLSYKNAYHIQETKTMHWYKKIVGELYMMIFVNHY